MDALSKEIPEYIYYTLKIFCVFTHYSKKKFREIDLSIHEFFKRFFVVDLTIFFLFITSAIQELQSNITQLMKQRDEAQLQANEKDRQLSELRREVNNVIDKKKRLEHELERLKQHLVQVEEGYTNEALASEERERELRKKLQVKQANYMR